MSVSKLNPNEIKDAMNQLAQWSVDSQQLSIHKEWRFNNFKTLVNFLNQVCALADEQNHHPEILTTYTNIRIRLWTHDCGGITTKDFKLAQAIDHLITSNFSQNISH